MAVYNHLRISTLKVIDYLQLTQYDRENYKEDK
jgi:hypothetical protein